MSFAEMKCCDLLPRFSQPDSAAWTSPLDSDSVRSQEIHLQLLHPAGFLLLGGGSGNNCISVSNSKGAEVASLV